MSTRTHSSYWRRLTDLPWQGRVVALQVRVRRFRCTSRECRRRIFAERLALTRPKARRTLRVGAVQQQIGLALGGEPGSRLAGRLAMPVSGDTLLRLSARARLRPGHRPGSSGSMTGPGGGATAMAA